MRNRNGIISSIVTKVVVPTGRRMSPTGRTIGQKVGFQKSRVLPVGEVLPVGRRVLPVGKVIRRSYFKFSKVLPVGGNGPTGRERSQ